MYFGTIDFQMCDFGLRTYNVLAVIGDYLDNTLANAYIESSKSRKTFPMSIDVL